MGARMKIIQPIDITPTTMAAGDFLVKPTGEELIVQVDEQFQVYPLLTNVPEDDAPPWSPTGTHEEGEDVMHNHHVYRATTDIAAGVEPGAETVTPESPAKWQDRGVTNRWRMFDEKIGTVTTNPESIEFSITPGSGIDSVAFFGVDASAVSITVYDAATGVVASRQTAPVLTDGVDDWYAYFFSPIELLEDFIMSGLPASAYYALDIKLLKPGGIAKVGAIVLGKTVRIGCARYGTSVGIVSFSRKDRDEFGNFIIVPRRSSKRADFDVSLDTPNVSQVHRLLTKYESKPVVWIGSENIEATILYGFYRDFSIIISGPKVSDCSIIVEGLT